jgi:hypothetical protein
VELVRDQMDSQDDERRAAFDEDETGREPLPMAIGRAERRLQVRAYSLWTGLLGDRQFPPVTALALDKLADLAPYGVLLDFGAGAADPIVRQIGARLGDECGPPGSITRLSDAPAGSLLSRISDHYREILAHQAPIGFEAEFVNWRGATILYRGILLPFSGDDQAIDHVFGVINWKELADSRIAEELALQIESSIEPLRRLRLDTAAAGEWPDDASAHRENLDESLAERLRRRAAQPLDAEGDEFALVLARRLPGGEIAYLGEIAGDPRLLDRAARRLLG